MKDLDLIYCTARGLPPEDRSAYLIRACGGDHGLRTRVEQMLAVADEAEAFITELPDAESGDRKPRRDLDKTLEREGIDISDEVIDQRIGRYKILERVGEGGCGVVYVAEQIEPVRRRVALKVIKLGMDTKQVVARFEAERQALAMMDHPNIAKVLDGGSTEQGRLFFVMELVRGIKITDYCDQANLSTKDRLDLFIQVCQAIQHAHQKGIIHRDIKPSNILVTVNDGVPVPKVIDFGIAKATEGRLTDATVYTQLHQFIGTPAYMSPEQAEMTSLDIDTRSDIYSLGVLLYELLAGSTPFDPKQLMASGIDAMRRVIREQEPVRPSTRLATLQGEELTTTARRRSTEAPKLIHFLKGDLDWIVMKCLEKDRTRRYETANGLAADLKRHLNDEPVTAGAPSAGYRLRKFVRRNKGPVAAGSVVAAALLIGVVAFAWQAKVARDQRDLAVQAQKAEAEQRKHADAARAEAQKQAAIAEAVAKFQTDMLAAADPDKLLGDKVTVLQAIQAAVKELDKGSLKDQPLVEAGVRNTIGGTLRGLARYDDAEPNLRKSLAIRRAALPAGHPDIAMGLNSLAYLLQSQNKLAEAEPLFREALAIDRAAALPAGHTDIAIVLDNLAAVLQDQNKLAEAEPLNREALAIRRTALPAGHPDIAISLCNLAWTLRVQNKLAEAEPLNREALVIFRAALPAGHHLIAKGLNNLAVLLEAQNKPAEAEPLYREALAISRAALPAGHPWIAPSLNNLAVLLQDQNKLAEAEPLCREALAIRRAALPAGHPEIAVSLNSLASLLQRQNKLAEAEPLYDEALAIDRATLPAGHPEIAGLLGNLAALYWRQGKLDKSVPLFEAALKAKEETLGRRHPSTLMTVGNLGVNYKDAGRLAEAIPLLEEAYQAAKQYPSLGFVGPRLLDAYTKAADPAKPETIGRIVALVQELLANARATLPKESPELAGQLALFSQTLLGLKAWDEADPLIREALTIREAKEPDDWRTFNTKSMLGGVLLGQKKLAEAEPRLLDGYRGMKEREATIPAPANTLRISEALERLVQLYEAKGNQPEATAWRGKLEVARAEQNKPAAP